jgi:regulator of sirC expression with transglutaminase-like and TPR domain
LDAVRRRRGDLNITLAAQVMVIGKSILPDLTTKLSKTIVPLLLRMSSQAEDKAYTGWESESIMSPLLLKRVADRATGFYNGLRKYPPRRLTLRALA